MYGRDVLSKDSSKATRQFDVSMSNTLEDSGKYTNADKCQSMWQWKNQGPGLSVKNRIVTLSPGFPMLTTSRIIGSTKLYDELPALRTT